VEFYSADGPIKPILFDALGAPEPPLVAHWSAKELGIVWQDYGD
jgi:hypothetical protein